MSGPMDFRPRWYHSTQVDPTPHELPGQDRSLEMLGLVMLLAIGIVVIVATVVLVRWWPW